MVFLDGVRGFAALAVLGLHLTSAVPHGFVAVDLFFLLSGYVVAQAYEARLAAGGPPGWFIAVRAARLYPLYVAGMAVNFCRVLWVKPALAAGWLAQGLLFFPAVSTAHAMRSYFPLDTASWSLSLEILVNLLFAFGGWRLSNRALLTVAAAAAAFLVFAALRFGTADLGSGVEAGLIDYLGGVCRVLLSFPLGVVFFRWRRACALPRLTVSRPLILALLAAAFFVPVIGAGVDLALIVLALPMLFCLMLNAAEPAGLEARLYLWAGRLSYPLYVTHVAFVQLALFYAARTGAPVIPLALAMVAPGALLAHFTVEPWGRRLIERLTGTGDAGRPPDGQPVAQPASSSRSRASTPLQSAG